jgi:DNA polymerase-3 subunit epsilon
MIVCVFDTETTGLIENHSIKLERQPEVIEFASVWADWDDLDTVIDKYEVLIKPHQVLPEKTKTTTHMTDADLVNCPSFAQVSHQIYIPLCTCDILCAHNLSYDMEMLDIEFERLGQKLMWPSTRLCTVEQTIHVTGNRIKLGDLYKLLTGEEHKDAHRAMPDVLATLRCLKEIRKRGWM